jgi:hypothetical protein
MADNSLGRESDDLAIRINELSTKSTQLLLFLTFAIVGAATLGTSQSSADQTLVRGATWWWILAVFPVLLGVLPVKAFKWNNRTGIVSWYGRSFCSCGRPSFSAASVQFSS